MIIKKNHLSNNSNNNNNNTNNNNSNKNHGQKNKNNKKAKSIPKPIINPITGVTTLLLSPSLPYPSSYNNLLTPTQQNAIINVRTTISSIDRQSIINRLLLLGYTENDLLLLKKYIIEACPFNIHFKASSFINKYLSDSHYRNRFEISIKIFDERRKNIEDQLFNNAYQNAIPNERIKYGVLNITNDYQGVEKARNMYYGLSYFLLKRSSVLYRTTICSQDSHGIGSYHPYTTTIDHFDLLLSHTRYTPDILIHQLIKLSKIYDNHGIDGINALSPSDRSSSSYSHTYFEVQYHGDIRFDRDIEAVYLHPNEKNVEEQVKLFCQKNKCELRYINIDS